MAMKYRILSIIDVEVENKKQAHAIEGSIMEHLERFEGEHSKHILMCDYDMRKANANQTMINDIEDVKLSYTRQAAPKFAKSA